MPTHNIFANEELGGERSLADIYPEPMQVQASAVSWGAIVAGAATAAARAAAARRTSPVATGPGSRPSRVPGVSGQGQRQCGSAAILCLDGPRQSDYMEADERRKETLYCIRDPG